MRVKIKDKIEDMDRSVDEYPQDAVFILDELDGLEEFYRDFYTAEDLSKLNFTNEELRRLGYSEKEICKD